MISLTWSSALIFVLLWTAQNSGVLLTEDELQAFLITTGKFIAMAGIFYGRWRHGDIKNIFGVKKS